MLTDLGATVSECPTIKLLEPANWNGLDEAVNDIKSFSWLLLTSANSVQFFFKRLRVLGVDARVLGTCKVCVVGPKTAEAISSYGILPDLIPSDYKAEGIISEFSRIGIKGLNILYPRVDKARDLIPKELEHMGAHVTSPIIYRNVLPDRLCPETILALEKRSIDCITFTSSSTVQNMAALLGTDLLINMLKGVTVASIGPVTSKSCRELGLRVDIEPSEYTLSALSAAIQSYFTD